MTIVDGYRMQGVLSKYYTAGSIGGAVLEASHLSTIGKDQALAAKYVCVFYVRTLKLKKLAGQPRTERLRRNLHEKLLYATIWQTEIRAEMGATETKHYQSYQSSTSDYSPHQNEGI